MKALKLFSIAIMGMAITLTSCSGEDGKDGQKGDTGDTGNTGDTGPKGDPGEDKPNMDFYFQDGFKNYAGTADATITTDGIGINEDELALLYSDNGLAIGERRSVIRFDGIDEVITAALVDEGENCTDAFYVNKAILYVYITSYTNADYDNLFMKVGFYGDEDPLFVENEVTWTAASASDDWGDEGGESEQWAAPLGPDDYPFLLPKGSGSAYGWYPILLHRSAVERWICNPNTANKGIRLSLDPISGDLGEGTVKIAAKDHELEDLRPLLVIETEDVDSATANKGAVGSSKKTSWEDMTYEEKMAPLYRFLSSK